MTKRPLSALLVAPLLVLALSGCQSSGAEGSKSEDPTQGQTTAASQEQTTAASQEETTTSSSEEESTAASQVETTTSSSETASASQEAETTGDVIAKWDGQDHSTLAWKRGHTCAPGKGGVWQVKADRGDGIVLGVTVILKEGKTGFVQLLPMGPSAKKEKSYHYIATDKQARAVVKPVAATLDGRTVHVKGKFFMRQDERFDYDNPVDYEFKISC